MYNFIKRFSKEIIIIIILIIIWIIIGMSDDQFIRTKELLGIIVWPSVALFGALFFNKVFTYLFFSVRKFNFFGMEGELKNPVDVINEQVENRLREKEEKEGTGKLFKTLKVDPEQEAVLEKLVDDYRKRLFILEQENAELKKRLNIQSFEKNKETHGCSLENLSACDEEELMKLIESIVKESKK